VRPGWRNVACPVKALHERKWQQRMANVEKPHVIPPTVNVECCIGSSAASGGCVVISERPRRSPRRRAGPDQATAAGNSGHRNDEPQTWAACCAFRLDTHATVRMSRHVQSRREVELARAHCQRYGAGRHLDRPVHHRRQVL